MKLLTFAHVYNLVTNRRRPSAFSDRLISGDNLSKIAHQNSSKIEEIRTLIIQNSPTFYKKAGLNLCCNFMWNINWFLLKSAGKLLTMLSYVNVCCAASFVVLVLFASTSALTHRRFEYKHSFKGPHLVQRDGTIPFWEHGGRKYFLW